MALRLSGLQDERVAGRRRDNLRQPQFPPRAGAMAGHDLIGLKRLQETPNLPELMWRGTAQMKTANQRVNVLDAGGVLAMAHDIHQPAMAASGTN